MVLNHFKTDFISSQQLNTCLCESVNAVALRHVVGCVSCIPHGSEDSIRCSGYCVCSFNYSSTFLSSDSIYCTVCHVKGECHVVGSIFRNTQNSVRTWIRQFPFFVCSSLVLVVTLCQYNICSSVGVFSVSSKGHVPVCVPVGSKDFANDAPCMFHCCSTNFSCHHTWHMGSSIETNDYIIDSILRYRVNGIAFTTILSITCTPRMVNHNLVLNSTL